MQTPATPELSLVAGAGVSGSSPLVGSPEIGLDESCMMPPAGPTRLPGQRLTCYDWSLERGGVALHTPRRFRMEGHRVHIETVVTDNLGNHDNRGKEPSARRVEFGLLCPQQPGRWSKGTTRPRLPELSGLSVSAVWTRGTTKTQPTLYHTLLKLNRIPGSGLFLCPIHRCAERLCRSAFILLAASVRRGVRGFR